MKTFVRLLVISISLSYLYSCTNKSSTDTSSDIAQIVAFSFNANDSVPGLGEAVFVVDQMNDTGLIRLRKNDSLRYGTSLTRVVPKITYYTAPSAVTFYIGDTAVRLTGYDTLDLSQKPIKIHVVAQNTNYDKWYHLNFEVHQVDGDVFAWDTLQQTISTQTTGTIKVLNSGQNVYLFQNDGFTLRCFLSDNLGTNWQERTVQGLPASCRVEQITLDTATNTCYYAQERSLYTSANGYEWQRHDLNLDVMALYMFFSGRLWLAARGEDHIARLYTWQNGQTQVCSELALPGDSLPIQFPVSDFSVTYFRSTSQHSHVLIAGGYDRLGRMTDGRWSIEDNFRALNITNIVPRNDTFGAFAGAGIVYYGKLLYMIGGMRAERSFLPCVYTSKDEGAGWTELADSVNPIKPFMVGRQRVNAFVQKDHLYIIGGEDNSTTYSDLYRGRKNDISWPEIGN